MLSPNHFQTTLLICPAKFLPHLIRNSGARSRFTLVPLISAPHMTLCNNIQIKLSYQPLKHPACPARAECGLILLHKTCAYCASSSPGKSATSFVQQEKLHVPVIRCERDRLTIEGPGDLEQRTWAVLPSTMSCDMSHFHVMDMALGHHELNYGNSW